MYIIHKQGVSRFLEGLIDKRDSNLKSSGVHGDNDENDRRRHNVSIKLRLYISELLHHIILHTYVYNIVSALNG